MTLPLCVSSPFMLCSITCERVCVVEMLQEMKEIEKDIRVIQTTMLNMVKIILGILVGLNVAIFIQT